MDKEKILRLLDEANDIVSALYRQGANKDYKCKSLREKLNAIEAEIHTSPKSNSDLYDLLCDMNANFINGNPHCVLEAITGANMICKHESCDHCVAEWLQEEESGNDD